MSHKLTPAQLSLSLIIHTVGNEVFGLFGLGDRVILLVAVSQLMFTTYIQSGSELATP